MPVDPTNELTWAIIAMPENEHKKLIRLSFRGIEIDKDASRLHPLVISILPSNTEYRVSWGILKKYSRLLIKIAIRELLFISEIMTEKIIINPPIFNTVVIEFSTEFLIAIPKLGLQSFLDFRELIFLKVLFFFVIIPIIIHEI